VKKNIYESLADFHLWDLSLKENLSLKTKQEKSSLRKNFVSLTKKITRPPLKLNECP
jgi:hypothetical protein